MVANFLKILGFSRKGLWIAPLVLAGFAFTARAENFIGLAQPGTPGTFALQLYPTFTHVQPNTNGAKAFLEYSYTTKTGITPDNRDQFEVWLGGYGGYQTPHTISNNGGWGIAAPEIGLEYYYHAILPEEKSPFGTPGYRDWYISPTLALDFPNGFSKTSGFGAGADQYTLSASVNNFIGFGRYNISVNPVQFSYAFRNRNVTETDSLQGERLRGGLNISLFDTAVGYAVSDTLIVGVHHAYNIYAAASSDFQRATEGIVGPTFTYLGLAKLGIYVSGTLDFDYHASNTPKTTAINMMIIKEFD